MRYSNHCPFRNLKSDAKSLTNMHKQKLFSYRDSKKINHYTSVQIRYFHPHKDLSIAITIPLNFPFVLSLIQCEISHNINKHYSVSLIIHSGFSKVNSTLHPII